MSYYLANMSQVSLFATVIFPQFSAPRGRTPESRLPRVYMLALAFAIPPSPFIISGYAIGTQCNVLHAFPDDRQLIVIGRSRP